MTKKVDKKEQKTVKAKHGLKPFAFFSGVLDTAVGATIIALGVVMFLKLLTSMDTGNEGLNELLGVFLMPFIIVIALIFSICGVLFLTMGILTLISSFKSDRRNLNGLLKAVVVFDVLLLASSIMLTVTGSGDTRTIGIVFVVVLSVGLVFKVIDLLSTRQRLKEYQEAKQEEYKNTYKGPNFENLGNSAPEKQPQTEDADQTEEKEDQQKPEEKSNGADFSNLGK